MSTQSSRKGIWSELKKLRKHKNKLKNELDECDQRKMNIQIQYAACLKSIVECEGNKEDESNKEEGQLRHKKKRRSKRKSRSKLTKKRSKTKKRKKTTKRRKKTKKR